ncbi:HNH endonuclease family protein [Candidatus Palauibacter sp.]|uniref:HNH endonuclease family protein n=1 Tax=Candidatus Palauibacter sp. TaxID=3101350 RepID=UPI003B0281EC
MKTETEFMRVEELLGLRKKNMMFENTEYQRGKVWTPVQQQLLIDSVLRGYSIPSFHLHFIEDREGSIIAQRFEVIDGQQRLRALSRFREGSFKLLNPTAEDLPPGVLFTNEAKKERCAWADKTFADLDEGDRDRFLGTELIVVKVTDASKEAVRDLFIRQQGGTPLKPQEIRDAWPGGMTEVILQIGGKQGLDRCPGHDFFRELARNPGRPEGRQMAAQMLSLLVARRDTKQYRGIARRQIDQFYYDHLSITDDDPHVKRFRKILNTLVGSLYGHFTFRLVAHEAISLMLLVDEWLDNSVTGWQQNLAGAFLDFRDAFAVARKKKREGDATDPYWLSYGVHTQTASDQGETIRARYDFFREKMTEIVAPESKDPQRTADPVMKDTVFRSQDGKCAVCAGQLRPGQIELHHIDLHSRGGKTIPENLAAVHPHCHPKSEKELRNFREQA